MVVGAADGVADDLRQAEIHAQVAAIGAHDGYRSGGVAEHHDFSVQEAETPHAARFYFRGQAQWIPAFVVPAHALGSELEAARQGAIVDVDGSFRHGCSSAAEWRIVTRFGTIL